MMTSPVLKPWWGGARNFLLDLLLLMLEVFGHALAAVLLILCFIAGLIGGALGMLRRGPLWASIVAILLLLLWLYAARVF